MRVLLLLRGAPGCGKSTFIEEHGLKPYTLCADDIRVLCSTPQLNVNGTYGISQKNEKDVWSMLFKLLETRMKRGEFTVIDATNSKTIEMNRYKDMCETYRYRIYCIDMTDVPLEECKRRNKLRPMFKWVPESALENIYSRFATQKIPAGIKAIKPEELDTIWMKKFDLNKYEKIVHIGDIHGCYTALMEYFKNGFNDNYMYIFVGDIIDRGLENAEVVKFFIEAVKRPNVLLLEGNHERWLWIYANEGIADSKEFEFVTKKQLQNSGIDLKDIRQLYRKCGQCAWYTYDGKDVLVTHGGLSTMPDNLTVISTEQMIRGVGDYKDYEDVAKYWKENTGSNMYQIHGHRNIRYSDMCIEERTFNLEGKIEHGGCLRIVELDKEGFHEVTIQNTVFKTIEEVEEKKTITNSDIADAVMKLRKNRHIQEKQYGNISSFNFTKDAFYDKIWNEQTIVARGLYINTNTMKVVCRGYSKFFNINERPETQFDMLQYKLKFPVTCYVKENGYLGLVSYNEETDDLFITTKSCPVGSYAEWLKIMFYQKLSEDKVQWVKEYCKENNVTLVFECVDQVHDPHIIEYPENELFLLSIIDNSLEFKQHDYEEVIEVGKELELTVKTKAFVINNWSDFYDWYNEVLQPDYTFGGRVIEGFVIEDSVGYMTKLKLDYYNHWKHMRKIAMITLRKGYIDKTGQLLTPESNLFYDFMKKVYSEHSKEEREHMPKDIIYYRKLFYKNQNK